MGSHQISESPEARYDFLYSIESVDAGFRIPMLVRHDRRKHLCLIIRQQRRVVSSNYRTAAVISKPTVEIGSFVSTETTAVLNQRVAFAQDTDDEFVHVRTDAGELGADLMLKFVSQWTPERKLGAQEERERVTRPSSLEHQIEITVAPHKEPVPSTSGTREAMEHRQLTAATKHSRQSLPKLHVVRAEVARACRTCHYRGNLPLSSSMIASRII